MATSSDAEARADVERAVDAETSSEIDRIIDRWDALHRVTAFLGSHNVEGWIEYWMWEVVEGTKPWPFWMEPNEQVLSDMRFLRNEADSWFSFDLESGKWGPVPLEQWVEHVKTCSYRDAQDRCAAFYKTKKEKEVLPGQSTGVEVGEQKAR